MTPQTPDSILKDLIKEQFESGQLTAEILREELDKADTQEYKDKCEAVIDIAVELGLMDKA